jgi:hypothetical protein
MGVGVSVGVVSVFQRCVVRSFETLNAVKYAYNAKYLYNTIVSVSHFGKFGPKMDPICPEITLNVYTSVPIYHIICYIIALKLGGMPFRVDIA